MSFCGSGIGVLGQLEAGARLGLIVGEGVPLWGDGSSGGSWRQLSFACTTCVAGDLRHGGSTGQLGVGSCYSSTQFADLQQHKLDLQQL